VKLRILNNSVRLRLTRTEVETLDREGLVKARTDFPGDRDFQYVVESSPASVKPGAFFSDRVMTVRLPDTTVREWAASDEVSIQANQLLDGGETLKILVEKDFQCLTGREDEDESDMFPHPAAERGETC
jgi:hypothetical protein